MDKLNHGFTKPELLAPAGDIESFNQAIHAGADAIYLGLDCFNARIKAENFNSNNIKSVIQKAHLYGVKVYITVNILVKDDEVDEFLKLVRLALEAGADAFIVQDFGMATLLKQIYPDIVLHASTQMGIHNADGALLLKKLGFTRVVLSRETKLSDILDIKQKTGLEIEFFVQGALCVAFSGNCYMSSLKNGNSGNRGLCKQLCRLNYSCDNIKGYLLSPNDLCLMENLKVLAKHGVTSFKIEGRLKRPAYVKTTVESYRKIIDNNYTANFIKEQEQIAKVFTRGKYNTTAYLYDNFDIIDTKNQAHYGAKIGEVLSVAKFKDLFKITIKSDVSISEGDGLKFVGNSETSIGVGNVEVVNNNYVVYTKNSQIMVKDKVYKALDFEFERKLLSTTKRLPINAKFIANKNDYPVLELNFLDISIKSTGDTLLEQAKSQPLDKEGVLKQLKFTDTPFTLNNLTFVSNGVFMPKSSINALRRACVDKLINTIIKLNTPTYDLSNINPVNTIKIKKQRDTSYVILNEAITLNTIYNDKTVIISPLSYDKNTLSNFIISLKNNGYNKCVYVNLPIVATKLEVEYLDNLLKHLLDTAGLNIGVVANNYYALKYVNDYPVIAGIGLNVYNKYTFNALLTLGVKDCINSIELSSNLGGLIYSGNPALMTLCHCPYKVSKNSTCDNCLATSDLVYKDEKGNPYKIRRYKVINCYFEVLFDGKDEFLTKRESADIYDLR